MTRPEPIEVGDQFGDLTVIGTGVRKPIWPSAAHKYPDGCAPAARVRCACGNQAVIHLFVLRSGQRIRCRSCGTSQRASLGRIQHGLTRHPLYPTWNGIKNRCLRPNAHDYSKYGGMGIRMDAGWAADPAAFIAWLEATLGPRPEGHTLDRIDPAGHYVPGNLRWASYLEQRHNRRAA